MKFARLLAVFCAFLLAACAPQGLRLVDTKDDASFATMYRAMKPAMLQKKMVASDGSWYTPLVSLGPDDAGLKLVDGLSPKFLGSEWNDPTTKVMRDILSPWDTLSIGPYSATLRMGMHSIKLQLTAVTDWNEDGKDDWLVMCRVTPKNAPQEAREYFLLVADTEASVMHAHVLMELQHRYSRVRVLHDNSMSRMLAPVTVEIEQGEADVTVAPTQGQQSYDDSRVKSSSLSQ